MTGSRELRRFEAKSETGEIYVVIEYQTLVRFQSVAHGTSMAGGTKFLELDDGRALNFINENTFEIVETGETLRRIA